MIDQEYLWFIFHNNNINTRNMLLVPYYDYDILNIYKEILVQKKEKKIL